MQKLNTKEFDIAITENRIKAIKLYNQRTKAGLKKSVYVVDNAISINNCIESFLKAASSYVSQDSFTLYGKIVNLLHGR